MRRSSAYRKHCVRNDELMAFQSHNRFLTQLGFVLTAARMASISSFPKNGFSITEYRRPMLGAQQPASHAR